MLSHLGHLLIIANHLEHTFYIIQAIPLIGVTELNTELIANVARDHRKSAPKLKHEPYEAMAPKHRLMISKLAAILRLADALDHEHAATVDAVEVEYKQPRFHFRLKGTDHTWQEK